MRKVTFLAVLALAATGAMVLAGAGSAAKPTTAAASPRVQSNWTAPGVVRQVGLRNYAGPNCPGKGWNCTTATRVLQVAQAGGTNLGVCTGSPAPSGPNQTCTINQVGGSTNTARCTEQSSDSSASLTCTIVQSGASNFAYVNQNINQGDGSAQTGTETATVTQGPASVTNYVQISQAANQSSKTTTGGTQNQNADQSATVTQTAAGSGTNTAALNQTELQKEYARGTTQSQNTTSALADCNPNDALHPGPTAPNVCANVFQHSESGNNSNQLRQNVSQDQNATGVATQTQGNLSGGIDARVHQEITTSGSSSNTAVLSKNQHQTAASGSTQTQHDPMSCCGFGSQDGGTNNTENISLSSSESASGDSSPDQTSDLIGTSHTPTGSCTITTKASINQDSANSTDTESPCPFLTLETSCTSGSEGGCSASPPDTSNPNPPLSAVTIGVRNVSTGQQQFTQSAGGATGDVIEFQVLYSNTGGGPATNVSGSAPVPTGMGSPVNVNCPNTCGVNFDPTSGLPTSVSWNLGTVSPNAGAQFTTVTFNMVVTAPTSQCVQFSEKPTVTTTEEGAIPVTPAAGVLFTGNQCIF